MMQHRLATQSPSPWAGSRSLKARRNPNTRPPVPLGDYHQHLFSPELAALLTMTAPVAEVKPPTAADLIEQLDAAGIKRAVVLSTGYIFEQPSRNADHAAEKLKRDNDWTSKRRTVSRPSDRILRAEPAEGLCARGVGPLCRGSEPSPRPQTALRQRHRRLPQSRTHRTGATGLPGGERPSDGDRGARARSVTAKLPWGARGGVFPERAPACGAGRGRASRAPRERRIAAGRRRPAGPRSLRRRGGTERSADAQSVFRRDDWASLRLQTMRSAGPRRSGGSRPEFCSAPMRRRLLRHRAACGRRCASCCR